MKGKRKDTLLFWTSLVLFGVHQFMQKYLGIAFTVVDNYLDPLLAMPVILQLIVWERKLLFKQPDYTMPVLHLFGYCIIVSLASEVIFPLINPEFVADPWDVFFYAVGGFWYAVLHLPAEKRKARVLLKDWERN